MLRLHHPLGRCKLANIFETLIKELSFGDLDLVVTGFGSLRTWDPKHAASAVDLHVESFKTRRNLFNGRSNEFMATRMSNVFFDNKMEALVPGEVDPWSYIYKKLEDLYKMSRLGENLFGIAIHVYEKGTVLNVKILIVSLDASECFILPIESDEHRPNLANWKELVNSPVRPFTVSKEFVWFSHSSSSEKDKGGDRTLPVSNG